MAWPLLTTLLPGRPSLVPMTAFLLIVAGAAIVPAPIRRPLASRLAAVEAAGGLAIVVGHALALPARGGTTWPLGSSYVTGIAFVLSGYGTLLLANGRAMAGQVVAFLVLLLTVLLGLGHVFPTVDLSDWLPGTGVAIPTVLAFIALSVAQLLSFADAGPSAALTSRHAAGRAGRRLLLAGVACALPLTAAVVTAHLNGWVDAVTSVLLLAWCAIALLGATVWGLAIVVHRAESAGVAAEEERNQMRQPVVAAITHDLRNPLHADTMLGHLPGHLVEEPAAKKAVHRLQRSHRRIDRLLPFLLDSVSVGAGQRVALSASPVDLRALADEVVHENESQLGGRVRVVGDASGWWDREALFRVLENLLLNAVRYGRSGSEIGCRLDASGDRVVVRVDNQGDAIPVGEWEQIFQPFRRGDAARHPGKVGWGVGLAYARAVASGHGGSVGVAASGPGGTTFELRLPADSRPWWTRRGPLEGSTAGALRDDRAQRPG